MENCKTFVFYLVKIPAKIDETFLFFSGLISVIVIGQEDEDLSLASRIREVRSP